MQILTVDIETFYDRSYSLSKLTTEEYIRHEYFETIGVSVKIDDEPTQWFSGPERELKQWLNQFPWDDCVAVAHNAMFDMAILNWRYDIRPKRITDTLSMLRAIDGPDAGNSLAKAAERYGLGVKGNEVVNALGKRRLDFTPDELARYGEYCKNDVELTYELFKLLAPITPASEFKLIDLTMRMFTEPVLELDEEVLATHLTEVKDKKEALMDAVTADKSVLMSNPKLADLLISLKVVPPTKISARTGKTAWAFGKTDEEFKDLLNHSNPKVQAIVAARLGVKSTLEETRTERFIAIAKRGALPVPLRYYAAHTGRWGGDDKINLQNLPRKSALKKAIKAPKGYVFIDCDSSQIEARTLAWLAGQDDLVEAFDRGEDVYKIMASAIYDVLIEEVTDTQRFVGKTTILGCLAEGTQVLTDRGWVAIENVTMDDRLWDGEEWVCHQGLVKKGTKETLNICGLWLTPDHKVLCGTQWLEAQLVAQDSATLSLALGTGAVAWLSPATLGGYGVVLPHSSSGATADVPSTPWTGTTLRTLRAHVAPSAGDVRATASVTGGTLLHSLTSSIGCGSSIGSLPQSVVATCLTIKGTPITEAEGSSYTRSGVTTAQPFSGMCKPYPDGTTPRSIWTAKTITATMNPVTSGSSLGRTTTQTGEKLVSCRRNLMTYDIAYAGPRNRYTVATAAGPLIVHNCGYGMGPARFQEQLKAFGVSLPFAECQHIIRTYRQTYPKIVQLWDNAKRALVALHSQRSCQLGREGVLQVDLLGIKLPNGMYLRYNNLRTDADGGFVYDTKKGRATIATRIYGGKVVENVCQALARIIIGEQMLMVARRLRVVMTVHDAVGSLAPEAQAGEARTFVEQCMRTRPKWAAGLPLNCESKMGATYGG